MTNKKNKLNNLFAVALVLAFSLFLGLTYYSKAAPKIAKTPYPLFGHFYPNTSTNILSISNSRYGSGVR